MSVNDGHAIRGKIRMLKENVLGCELEFGMQTTAKGIIIPDDDMKDSGVKSRWCKVYAAGPKADQVKPGQYILVDHGRWSRGFYVDEGNVPVLVRFIDYKDVFLVADERPYNYNTK